MHHARGILLFAILAASLIAGCSENMPSSNPAAAPVPGTSADPEVAGLSVYTTPDPGGARRTATFSGTLTPDEAAQSDTIPNGATLPGTPFQAYAYDSIATPDLLIQDQLVSIRITVNWTNTDSNHAGLDAAACMPWNCLHFNAGPDESQDMGPQSDVVTLVTAGRDWFAMPVFVGAHYTNAVLTEGLDYTAFVEVQPMGNAMALGDPYQFDVAEGATLTLELVGAFQEEVAANLFLYGADHLPFEYKEFAGEAGSIHAFNLTAGSYVAIPFGIEGAFPRLYTDVRPDTLATKVLKEESGLIEVAVVPDMQTLSGSYRYAIPPGDILPMAWFIPADGVQAQSLGQGPELGATRLTMTSSTGVMADFTWHRLGVQAQATMHCVTCTTDGTMASPPLYVDDDGAYDIEWTSSGAPGRFVVFFQRYLPE